jgi:hypothetical protein
LFTAIRSRYPPARVEDQPVDHGQFGSGARGHDYQDRVDVRNRRPDSRFSAHDGEDPPVLLALAGAHLTSSPTMGFSAPAGASLITQGGRHRRSRKHNKIAESL